jgi:hypothetical protein
LRLAGVVTDQGGLPLAVPVDSPVTVNVVAPIPNVRADQNEVGQYAVGSEGLSTVTVYHPNSTAAYFVRPFDGAGAGARVVMADVTGDGVPDLVAGTGPGTRAQVAIFDGARQQLVRTLLPFEDGFMGGLYVAAADVDGDGLADVAVSADMGGGPRVTIYSSNQGRIIANFLGIDDANFRGGARVAFGDVDGDGTADLAVAAGFEGGPRVALFDGTSLRSGQQVRLVNDFFIFEPQLRNGAFVALGDLNGDGFAEVIGGGGPSGAPRVLALDGRSLLEGRGAVAVVNFFAEDDKLRTGVQVSVKDFDGDRFADLVIGVPTPRGGIVNTYPGATLIPAGEPPIGDTVEAFSDPLLGIFVG